MKGGVLGLWMLAWMAAPAWATEVYTGEPLSEALYDLQRLAKPVSAEAAPASRLEQMHIFRLADGRMLEVTARTRKAGDPFTVWKLRVTPTSGARLSARLPAVASVKLSH